MDFDDDNVFGGGFHEPEIGRLVKIYANGNFVRSEEFSFQPHWSWDEFLCAASQRLEMVPKAQRVFNANGAEIQDIVHVEDDDMLFFSTGEDFAPPQRLEELSSPAGSCRPEPGLASESGHLASSSSSSPRDTNNDDGTTALSSSSYPRPLSVEESSAYQGTVGGYQVSTFLGKGGFGEVRLGVHQITRDKVALKFILKSEMGSLGDVERTTTEIQCLTALNHANIIKLLRIMNEPEHMVLCVELLEGGDLLHYLEDKSVPNLDEAQCRLLFHQIVSGVGYAHNQHICHRDLKLENILLAKKHDLSDVKIADFGLSDFYRPGAVVKTNCGTLSYLAPEVFRGQANAGTPLDVWSLGVILYAMLARKLPFEGTPLNGPSRGTREQVLRNRILKCQYPMERHFSAEFQDLLRRLLCDDPMERATMPEIVHHPWMRDQLLQPPLVATTTTAITTTPTSDDDDICLALDSSSNHDHLTHPPVLSSSTTMMPKIKLSSTKSKSNSNSSGSQPPKVKATTRTTPTAPGGGQKMRSPRMTTRPSVSSNSPHSLKKRDSLRIQTLSTKL